MRYWDTSAILPLLIEEPMTPRTHSALDGDRQIVTWWGTRVECASAIARHERDGVLTADAVRAAFARLDAMAGEWSEIPPIDDVRSLATRMLRTHRLRAADALQLAAAGIASGMTPANLMFATFDRRLAEAADREGHPLAFTP